MRTVVAEMRESIVFLAGQRDLHATRESWLAVAARKAGITRRQAKSLFYGESPDPRASIVERVRAARGRMANEREGMAREFYRETIDRIAALEKTVAALTEDQSGRPDAQGQSRPYGRRRTDRPMDCERDAA